MRGLKLVVLTLAIGLLAVGSVFAQNMKGWTWKPYNLKFSIPSNLKVTKADSKIFSASDGKSFSLNIAPWKDASATAKGIAESTYKNYKVSSKEIVAQDEVTLESGDYQGYMIVGKGIQSGKTLWFAIFGAIDEQSDVNFMTSFAWWDDEDQNEYFAGICDKIAGTFKKMN
jgi:hypothetical protein